MGSKLNTEIRYLIPKSIKGLSVKQLREKVEKYILPYSKYKIIIKTKVNFKKINEEQMEDYIKFIDEILANLSSISYEFFYNEYFSEKKDNHWWKEKYGKDSIIVIKRVAYSEFLNYVE